MIDNKIKVLDDIEHVLTVPSRYIGSISRTTRDDYTLNENDQIIGKEITFVPAFITLFREVISNSVDEFIRTDGKFANKIDVSISNNRKTISVLDNGRGLPHQIEEKTGEPCSVVAFTKLKAGTNFTEKTTSIGQNGEGVSLVNIFSKEFIVETSDGIKKTFLKCVDNLSKYEFKLTKNNSQFTKIVWTPDFKRLNMESIDDTHFNLIRKILLDMSMCYPGITFTFNKKRVPVKSFKDYVKLYGDHPSEVFTFGNIDIAILPAYDYAQISWVNGIFTRRGGIHVETMVYYTVNEYRNLVSKKYSDIKPFDIKNKLFFIVNFRNVVGPRFDSQTKEELINNKDDFDTTVFNDVDFIKIAEKIKSNKDISDNILEAFRIKEQLKKKKELEQKEKKIAQIDIPKLIESNHPIIEERILYIAEGDSALVNFLECREDNQAAFPLSGKVTNSNEKDSIDLAKSKKVMDLCKAMGLKLSSKKIDDLQYGKIVIFTDADYDGDSIACLLINLFWNCWPDLIHKGKVYKALSPLIKAVNIESNEKRYFYDNESFHNEPGEWKIIDYNKGLGSLSEEEYKLSLNNLVQIVIDDETEKMLEIAFGKDSNPRKEWMIKS